MIKKLRNALVCITVVVALLYGRDVSAQEPEPEAIKAAAKSTREFYNEMIILANARAKQLGSSISTWKWITKVGQYVGGGGAIAFGLDEQGRNAAYAGAVSALFTIIDTAKDTDAKSAEREQCRAIERIKVPVFNATQSGEFSADIPDFRKSFETTFKEFSKSLEDRFKECDLDLVASWQEMLGNIVL